MAALPPHGSDPKRPSNRGRAPNPLELVGVGVELALTVGLMTLGGWWLDEKLGTKPWLLLTGAFVGAVGSMYKLWNQGRRQFKDKPR